MARNKDLGLLLNDNIRIARSHKTRKDYYRTQ